MKKVSILIIVLINLIFLISLVSAITGSIGNARMIISGNVGSNYTEYITVNNINNVPINITLWTNATNIILSETNFQLQPLESRNVLFNVKIEQQGIQEEKINVAFQPESGNGVGLSATIITNGTLVSQLIGKDVAYVVKTSSSPNIISALDELGYSYSIITDSQIPSANFSQYALILVQDDLTNKALLPLNSKNLIFIENKISNGITSIVWPSADITSTSTLTASLVQLGTPFAEGFSDINFRAYTSSRIIYKINIVPSYVKSIAMHTSGSGVPKPIVAYSENNSQRIVMFGLPESAYWTADGKKLFSNSLKWVRSGVDLDGDGFFSDTDCNDSNSLVNPNAVEIPYNYIDENCDGKDLQDVDGDGFNSMVVGGTDCNDNNAGIWKNISSYIDSDKDGYGTGSSLTICTNGTLPSGYSNNSDDCNDSDSSIHPGANEIINGGDKNCAFETPLFIGVIQNFTWIEDTNLVNIINLNDYFKDYDKSNFVFSVYNTTLDKNITIHFASNGNISFTTSKDWNGRDWVVFKANNSAGLYNTSNKIFLNVLPANDAPVLDPIADITKIEGQKVIITAATIDIDNSQADLTFNISDLRFNQTSKGVFEWQTNLGDEGDYNVKISVSDGNLSNWKIVEIDVIPKIVINEFLSHDTASEWIEFYNPKNTSINLQGFTVEDGTGSKNNLSGILGAKEFLVLDPTFVLNDLGDIIILRNNEVEVDKVAYGNWNDGNTADNALAPGSEESAGRISDGYDTDSASDWKIFDYPTKGLSNSADVIPPIISLISPENNSEIKSSTVYFNFSVADNAASSLNCSFYSDFAGSFRLVASRIFQNDTKNYFWKSDFVNGNYIWQIRCSDGSNGGSSETRGFTINTPKAPFIFPIANITVQETEIARITVNASDVNSEDILNYSINDTRFLKDGNIFSWQTGYDDAGIYYVKITVTDGVFNASQIVKISVLEKNRAPVLTKEIENIIFNEDTSTSINLSEYFSDPDLDKLNFSVYSASLNNNIIANLMGSIVNFSSIKDWNGNGWIIFKAADSSGAYNLSNSVTITLNPVNDAPVLQKINNITINETETARIAVNAGDIDLGDGLTYWTNDTRFLQNDTNKNIFAWETGYNDAGNYYVKVSVSDGILNISQDVKISVLGKNRDPILGKIPDVGILEDSITKILLNGTDADGDLISYKISAENKSKVDCEVNSSGVLSMIPALNWNGNASCAIELSDGKEKVNQIVNISVLPVNDAPVIFPIADIAVQETEIARITVNAADIDNNISDLTFLTNDSRFLQNETNKNIFVWKTNYGDEEIYYVSVSVSDGINLSSKVVKVIVTNKNEPPFLQTISDILINEDSGFRDNISLNATDNDGTISRFEISKEDLGKVDCTLSDSSLGVRPVNDFFGNASCAIRVYDDKNAWDEKIVNIMVIGINDAPEIISVIPMFNPVIAENGNQIFSVNWKDVDNPQAGVKAEWFVNDILSGIENIYNYSGNEAAVKVKISDLENFTIYEWNVSTSKIPISSNYNGDTSEFTNETDLSNVNLILENIGLGRIEFIEPVDLNNQIDFNHYSSIDSGFGAIDTGYFSKLAGKLARITFYNLGFDKTPVIYYNSGFTTDRSKINQVCPEEKCKNISYMNGTLDFISSFSSFKIGNTLSCSQQSGTVCSEKENCQGIWINALESRCCSQSCIEIPPEFSDAETCTNSSDSIKLEIKKPDSGDEFSIGENISVEVKIKNTGKDDDYDIKAYLYDLDEDSVVKEVKRSITLDEDESQYVNLDIIVPENADENDKYAVLVYAGSDGGLCNQRYEKIDIKRDRKIIIKNIMAEPEELVCGESFDLSFDLKNLGKKSESVELSVINEKMKIHQTKNVNLEKYGGDDESKEIFTINVPEDIDASNYVFRIVADYGDRTEEEKIINVYDCQKLEIKKVNLNQKVAQSYSGNALKEDINTLNLLLVISIVLMIIAIVLVLILKRK